VAVSVGHSRQGKRKKQLLCPTTEAAYDFYRERHFREIETQTNPLPPLPGGLSLPLSQAAHTRTYWKLFSLQICKKTPPLFKELISSALIALICSTLHLALLPAASRNPPGLRAAKIPSCEWRRTAQG